MSDLTADPIYQLNAVLWMLQPLPRRIGAVRAVLYDAGYRVRALGKTLTASPEIERVLATKLNLKGAPAPDVIATAPLTDPWLVFECKVSSFSAGSSTSTQATKILARAADLSLVGGSPPGTALPGCVVYVTRKDQAADLQGTLDELVAQLVAAGLNPADVCTLGMRVETGVGLIVVHAGGSLTGVAAAAFANEVTVLEASGPEEDTRPLYLVPYDPSVEQSDEEQVLCLRILLARARAHAASLIGRNPAPGTAVIEGNALLTGATFGLSKLWHDHGARDRAAHEVLRFVRAGLNTVRRASVPLVTECTSPKRLEVVLTSEEQRQECAEAIMAMRLPNDPKLPEFVADELPFADLN
jgi:hypothetical protein